MSPRGSSSIGNTVKELDKHYMRAQLARAGTPSGPPEADALAQSREAAQMHVGAAEQALAPRPQEIAVAVEHHHGMLTAVEDVDAVLAVAGPRFKGIRHAAGWEDKAPEIHNSHTNLPPHLYRDHAKFREGFAVLGRLGLTLTALSRAFPAQPIVLDHVGGPLGLGWYEGRRDEIFAGWRRDILELAGCPNVYMKLGGLGMRINGFKFHHRERPPRPKTWPIVAALHRYLHRS